MDAVPTRRLNVVAIGGTHQLAHLLPVAFELQSRGVIEVCVFANTRRTAEAARQLATTLHYPAPVIREMTLSAGLARLPAATQKVARLAGWARSLRQADAILVAERTSTLLKRLPGHCPPMIHIPHGAGDRAKGFERRLRLFDLVLTAGSKDRDRMIGEGVAAPDSTVATGSVKIAAMARLGLNRPSLFASEKPIILYNPHFAANLGSFEAFAERLWQFTLADDRYNLVIAPHARLAQRWSKRRRAIWQDRARPGRVIVDLGSDASSDMSYTLASDIYVGDVSSQVYEFLVKPRPCVFINAHNVDWRDDPSYVMWNLGTVISPGEDLAAAFAGAVSAQSKFASVQEAAAIAALGRHPWLGERPSYDGIACAANAIEAYLA